MEHIDYKSLTQAIDKIPQATYLNKVKCHQKRTFEVLIKIVKAPTITTRVMRVKNHC